MRVGVLVGGHPPCAVLPVARTSQLPGNPNESIVPNRSLFPRLLMSGAAPLPIATIHDRPCDVVVSCDAGYMRGV